MSKKAPQNPAEAVVQQAAGYIRKWQSVMGVGGWSITVGARTYAAICEAAGESAVARVDARQASLSAEVVVATDWEWDNRDRDHDLERVMVHELAHIRLRAIEDETWNTLKLLEEYLPEAVANYLEAHWNTVREDMVETLVSVARAGEGHWKK